MSAQTISFFRERKNFKKFKIKEMAGENSYFG
jgi:hypothetical protein